MVNLKKYFIFYSGVSVLLLSFIYLYIGFYTEEAADNIFRVFNTQLFTSQTENLFNNYGALFIISSLIKKLNRINSSIPYYGMIFIFSMFLFLVNFFISNHLIIGKLLGYRARLTLFTGQLLTFLILLNSICLAQVTKISLLLFISSITLICSVHLCTTGFSRKKITLYILLCITLASLLRAEVLLICGFLSLPMLLILYKKQKDYFKSLVPVIFLITITLIVFIVLSNIPYNQNDHKYKNIQTIKVSLWDKEQDMNKLVLANKRDSIKYLTAYNLFLADPDSLNDSFFKKIHLQEIEKDQFYANLFQNIPYRLYKAQTYILSSIDYSADLNYNYIILLFLIPVYLLSLKMFKPFFWIVINILFYAALLYLIAFILKMEERILIPFLFMTYYSSIFIAMLYTENRKRISVNHSRYILPVIFILGSYNLFQKNSTLISEKQIDKKEIAAAQSYINTQVSNKIVVFNLWAWQLVFSHLLDTEHFSKNNNYISIDNGYLFLYKSYNTKMMHLTGSAKFIDHIHKLQEDKESVLFISTESRMVLLKNYIESIYEVPFNYRVKSKKPISNYKVYFTGQPELFYVYALN